MAIPTTASAQKKIDCVLISHTLCQAIHDKPVMILAGAHTGLLFSDGYYTNRNTLRGATEFDPISRAFVGRRPTWKQMAPVGAAWVIAEVYLTEKMRHSRNGTIRKLAFVPLSLGIISSAQGTAFSATH